MGRKVTLATCSLVQWAMDFTGNKMRIIKSFQEAKEKCASYRLGPELEICGYGCADHFHESDTILHCWEVFADLLEDSACQDIIADIGMPIMHKNVTYNCRIIFYNKKVLLIRPKMILCDDLNYRESRWFTAWQQTRKIEQHYLPRMIQRITGQTTVPFGDAVISALDTCIGTEICEELWNPHSNHIHMGLDGVEIFCNGSGSHAELRKSYVTVDLITSATAKSGGVYLFANLRGCDGDRLVFNGGAMISCNGWTLAQGVNYSLSEVEVLTATIDLEDVRAYRNSIRSRCVLAAKSASYPRVEVGISLSEAGGSNLYLPSLRPIKWNYISAEEEISLAPACWLWDYLRRSGLRGFFLPLSGGVDSASVATIVWSMCRLVHEWSAEKGDATVLSDIRRIVGDCAYVPRSPCDVCGRLLTTCYMASGSASTADSRERAAALARQIGSNHQNVMIDTVADALVSVFSSATKFVPKFRVHGGSHGENLALQNIQARVRMVLSYLFAQLSVMARSGGSDNGSLLVLGTSNVEEALRGYCTKYDCSSADLNPIGSISKKDLRSFMSYMKKQYSLDALTPILSAEPSAELEPCVDGVPLQSDEQDMGMTYDELSVYGCLRKQDKCGPYSMFCKLVHLWAETASPDQVAEKVKHFFRSYSVNRHKASIMTPSVHLESYSPDDNRHDHRQILYNINWDWQFSKIDQAVAVMTGKSGDHVPTKSMRLDLLDVSGAALD